MKTKVFVVEDDADVRNGIVEVLLSEGYEVETAENGQVAFDFLQASTSIPQIILLDIMMPVMDGLTFFQKIKSHERTDLNSIPIIITTASRTDGVRKTPGIAGFIGKPIDLDELFATISACLKRPESVELQP